MSEQGPVALIPLIGIPRVNPGDDLAGLIGDALAGLGFEPSDGDILVVAQKIVSKAEGRIVQLASVAPSPKAEQLAVVVDKDPRLVELILRDSRVVLRAKRGVLIVEHRLGFVMANAGIDHSNVENSESGERVLLLPENPDSSCRMLRAALKARFGAELGVIMTDSVGRAWRLGTVGIAIGVAGPMPLIDLRGTSDLFGRKLLVSETAFADSVAAAAVLVMGEGSEGQPAVLVRGLRWSEGEKGVEALLRPIGEDMFR
jgi:coenzyme F420-0:L-glutamate ligase/coenzyme F420-1:gamma-L-glutamate ligase